MKDFKYYSTVDMIYPSRTDYTTIFVYHRGEKLFEGTPEQFRSAEGGFPKGFVTERVFREEEYRDHQKEYGQKQGALLKEFAEDMYEEFDVVENPKKHKCYQVAWEHGHAAGLEDVYNWFQELVDLIK